MNFWNAIVLGVVEGITEYLPVSSTGHLILASHLMGLDAPGVKKAVNDFNIVIQGGAILAVVLLYRARVAQMCRGLMGRDAAGFALARNLAVAFLPAAVLGKLLDGWIDARLFFAGPVIFALGAGGVLMIWLDQRRTGRLAPTRFTGKEITDLSPLDAFKVGLLQCTAMWPGTSRSMMTIVGGSMVGLRPAAAAEFSFLVGLPTLGAACLYKLYRNLSLARETETPNLFETLGGMNCIVGIVVATMSAACAVKWLVGFLTRHGLTPFGVYRLILCAVLGVLVLAGSLTISE